MANIIRFGGGAGGSGSVGFPPGDVTGLAAAAGNEQVTITWSDPPDTVADGKTFVTWAGTKLVRKQGAYPTAPTDGILLVDNKVRGKYKTTGFVDTGLTNDTVYYYAVFPYSDKGAVNTDAANRATAKPQAYVTYGVRWYKTSSSPTLGRLYDSKNYSFTAKSATAEYSSDFDGKAIYKDVKLCNVVNGTVTAYEGEAGFSRTTADVMVEIPKFYYKIVDTDTYRDFIISDGAQNGFSVAPRHAPCTDYPSGADKIYVGAYKATSDYKSVSGAAFYFNGTRPTWRSGFTARGTGYMQIDWATQFELQLLIMIETASLDSQSVVGSGNSSGGSCLATGTADSLGAKTGSAGVNKQVVWRGIESLWGDYYEFRDGINFNARQAYACLNPSKYKDDTSTDYTQVGYVDGTSSGCIKSLGYDSALPWTQFPTDASGSSSTYFCDYYYQASSGWRVALVGGYCGSGSSCGLFYLSASSGSSDTFSSRLLVIPKS